MIPIKTKTLIFILLGFFVLFPALPLPVYNIWPIPDFWRQYSNFFVLAFLFLSLGLYRLIKAPRTLHFSSLSFALLALIVILFLQAIFGYFKYIEYFILPLGILLTGLWISCQLYHWTQNDHEAVAVYIAWGLVLGSALQLIYLFFHQQGFWIANWHLMPANKNEVRFGGSFFQANQVAAYIFLGVLAVCFLVLEKRLKIWSALFFLLIFMVMLSFTASRTAIVYVLLILPFLSWLLYKKQNAKHWFWPLFIIPIFFIIDFLIHFSGIETSGARLLGNFTLSARLGLMADAWKLFIEHPVLGVGFGQYVVMRHAILYPLGGADMGNSTHSHNLIFNVLAELGLIGFIVLVFFVFICARPLFTQKKWASSQTFFFGLLLVIGIYSLLEFPLWVAFFSIFTVFCTVMINGDHQLEWKITPYLSRLLGAGMLILAPLTFYVGWEYIKIEKLYAKAFIWQNAKTQALQDAARAWPNTFIWDLQLEKLLLTLATEYPSYWDFVAPFSEKTFTHWPMAETAPGRAIVLVSENKKALADALIERTCRNFPDQCPLIKMRYAAALKHTGVAN